MKVYYGEGTGSRERYEHAGKEISLRTDFWWAGKYGQIPAVYICRMGMAVYYVKEKEDLDIICV